MKNHRARLLGTVALAMTLALPMPAPRLFVALPAMAQGAAAESFNTEQLDALLAPIALYPDELLTQILMAATFPIEIVEASRWAAEPSNASLKGDALAKALEAQNWDPSVKSLVPFPQVLEMMNSKLDWTQQVGYAFATQQADVMNSVQRLRSQAQQAGTLASSPQQTVSSDQGAIVIQPADPQTVYVPVYNPTTVYGTWPYPAVPPVYFPPPPGYVFGTALATGIAFAAGAAVVGSLWGWARPAWGGGNVNVNVNRWNNINVNRTAIQSNVWKPPAGGVGGRPVRPPGGPVGAPARPNGLPANAIGRNSVQVPGGLVNRPAPGNGGLAGNRPAQPPGNMQRPANLQTQGNLQRPTNVQRPANPQRPANLSSTGAFGGVNDGARAAQFGARGAQSRSFQGGGGFQGRGGGGGAPRRGGGGRR